MMMFFLLGIEHTRAYLFKNIEDSVPISKLTLCIVIVVFDIIAQVDRWAPYIAGWFFLLLVSLLFFIFSW